VIENGWIGSFVRQKTMVPFFVSYHVLRGTPNAVAATSHHLLLFSKSIIESCRHKKINMRTTVNK